MTQGRRLRRGTKTAGPLDGRPPDPASPSAATSSAPTPAAATSALAGPAVAAAATPDPLRLVAGSDAVRRSARPPGRRPSHDARTAAASRGSRWPELGLVGRVEWERLVADESERQRRYGRPSAIVIAEVRGLDQVTAQAGYRGIERVIPPCGAALVANARASDRVTRLGDGRFGVLLREADADGAGRYAERARTACDDWLAALPWSVGLTVRWASPDGLEDLVGALRRAERELAEVTAVQAPGAS